ncbi:MULTISPECIES: NHLP family bacteriocin export ABC transporter peptidase/permease/ATPase subunit [Thiorhodovibrio]|uniref:NHLP family bacteriocin export ABC transporter peptidase/permease/ATPase subunit n=1 Tax=Thiorhodovibrio TaxID=61593 RepID=UPI00191429BF|nr:NHLP family bacteriocin export ABC transporter peptidase/permease/ATPase subunit [Thiorhodovibrio litoralis]MBK5969998.1 NHLP family bacteriocin export ABC transporter peptidase/permease/ATPase subunit [Thiorhodovibrio winogradskyi]WPL12920.1 Lactococcin-G-processing and transport ATP-binding protein LagD [Thiorhodovibrio litoralis]
MMRARRQLQRKRTPTILQMEAVECGAAALGIMLAYFGRWEPLETLRVETGVSRDGAKASNIVKAARHYGLDSSGMKLDLAGALALPPPFIVFWNFNHFVVFEGQDHRHVYLNDPAVGPRRITHQEFSDGFTGIALQMQPTAAFAPGGQRASLFHALSARLQGAQGLLSIALLATLMLVVPGLLVPALLKTFIDDVLVRGANSWILPLLVGLALVAVFSVLITWMQQRYLLLLRTRLAITSASQFFWHVLRVPVVFYTQRYVGDVAARVQSCHRLASLLSGPLSSTLADLLMIGFYLLVMLLYSVELTLVVVAFSLAGLGVAALMRGQLADINSRLLKQSGKLTGVAMAGLQAMDTLKASGSERDFFASWAGHQTLMINSQQSLGVSSRLLSAAPSLLNQGLTSLVLGLGGLLIIDGNLTVGALIAFQSMMSHVTGPVSHLIGFTGTLQTARGELLRINDVLDYPSDPLLAEGERSLRSDGPSRAQPDIETGTGTIKEPMALLSGHISVRNLTFGYSHLDPPLVDGLSLEVKPGQRIAFVGASGSGKSTLGRLLLGLYPPNSGEILYDGRPFAEIPREIFTASVAAVDQDIKLFPGSVLDNLRLWDTSISEADVVRAAQDACIHETIAARPGGYASEVGIAAPAFSGGQAQRMEIARALTRNPSVMILDEATAALEPLTEQQIDNNLRRRGCTCIIIAHRLSTIRDSDEIIVLKRGKVIERGDHDSLVAARGAYFRLVQAQ